MTKRVLVTGKNGQLGQSLQKIANDYSLYNFTFAGREDLDLSQPKSIESYFEFRHFDVIINCAAYTSVDKAESEPELADQINHLLVKQLAQIAKTQDNMLIHISTDYVFNGLNHKPYTEMDSTDPSSVYGQTKLKGELAIQKIDPKAIIIRTSWMYSEFGSNFVKTMLRLGKERDSLNVIYDQVGTPTYASDLAKAILEIIKHQSFSIQGSRSSIYHYSNEGACSWYDFAKATFELSYAKCQVIPIETREYPTPAKRPYYSLMSKSKIKHDFGLNIPYWKDSLKEMLQLGSK
jgi:dTDP-4-dehydrorhamnose reductase